MKFSLVKLETVLKILYKIFNAKAQFRSLRFWIKDRKVIVFIHTVSGESNITNFHFQELSLVYMTAQLSVNSIVNMF